MSYYSFKTCRKCSLVLIFLLFFQYSFAQLDFSRVTASITKYNKTLGKDYVVVVHKEAKNIFLKETEEFQLKTPVPIASSSKWLTAALVMIFVDEGKIQLDEPVSKYIPVFEKYMKGYITIRHCLTHTTGIDGDALAVLKIIQKSKFQNLEEEVNYFAAKKSIVDNPGSHFSYNGIGLNIAGRVLEIVTKKSFERIAVEKLFKPLGMRSTSFAGESELTNPSGGAVSSAFDYINFMQMILNKGTFNGKRILSEKSVAEILTNQFPDAIIRNTPEVAKGFQYAMGNWIEEKNESNQGVVFSCPGLFGAWPWIDLDKKYVAIILSKNLLNTEKKEVYTAIKKSIDQAIE